MAHVYKLPFVMRLQILFTGHHPILDSSLDNLLDCVRSIGDHRKMVSKIYRSIGEEGVGDSGTWVGPNYSKINLREDLEQTLGFYNPLDASCGGCSGGCEHGCPSQ